MCQRERCPLSWDDKSSGASVAELGRTPRKCDCKGTFYLQTIKLIPQTKPKVGRMSGTHAVPDIRLNHAARRSTCPIGRQRAGLPLREPAEPGHDIPSVGAADTRRPQPDAGATLRDVQDYAGHKDPAPPAATTMPGTA